MQRIILYYKFVPLPDPEATKLWQKTLAETCNLKGRIIISSHGINATLGGELKDLKSYLKQTKTHSSFKNLDIKWSDGLGNDFPKLSVKVKPELVTFGVVNKIKVNDDGIIGGGKRLKPEQVHQLVKNNPDTVFFDGRNKREADIGRFKDAVIPNVKHTRDFPKELKKTKYQKLKNHPVVTYCTGGIRCEVLTTLMKQEGFKDVYQIDGGIVKYGEKYGDDGLWQGKLYVFDGRITTEFSNKAKDIAKCSICSKLTSNYENCEVKSCNAHVLICQSCMKDGLRPCQDCAQILSSKSK